MGSSAVTLFLCLNLILFTYTSAVTTCNNCQKKDGGDQCSKECGKQGGSGKQEGGKGQGQGGSKGRQQGSSKGGGRKGAVGDTCPLDALKLGVCADLLRDLLKIQIGEPPVQPCCSLIKNLVDVEAALCLCNVIKVVSVAGIKLNVPLSLSLLLNTCGRTPPAGFQCPPPS